MKEINAKGLACPKPVVKAKKAMTDNDQFLVIVDNRTAVENLSKLGKKMNAEISVVEESESEFKVMFKQSERKVSQDSARPENKTASLNNESEIKKVYYISSDTMGEGERELGKILIKAFLSTAKELEPLPKKIIFINSGVKLAVLEKDVVELLKELEELGIEILLCGTCIDYYELKDKMQVGEISNMYEIASSLNSGNVVKI